MFFIPLVLIAMAQNPNGFDVSVSNIDTAKIIQGGPPRDGIPAIDDPKFEDVEKATWMKETDIVVGVVIDEIARAYPLRILQYHECVNDVIGSKNIAVTYCPLCQSSFVFDRSYGKVVYDFGTSGMLWNSNVLLYDRQTESLWSQAAMKAVTGEAAKNKLALHMLPATMSTWKEWVSAHPTTTVLSRETGHKRNYAVEHYSNYFSSPNIWFEVDSHLDNPREFELKEEMLLVEVESQFRLYSIQELIETGSKIIDTFEDSTITILVNAKDKTVRVVEPIPNATIYWFAASACLPKATLWSPKKDIEASKIK